jgi:transposase-like protein
VPLRAHWVDLFLGLSLIFKHLLLISGLTRYEYVAIAPKTGRIDFMTADEMNTESMTKFLWQVSRSHWNKFIIMVVDGASSHKALALKIAKKRFINIFTILFT